MDGVICGSRSLSGKRRRRWASEPQQIPSARNLDLVLDQRSADSNRAEIVWRSRSAVRESGLLVIPPGPFHRD
jgi:hypothetical protein